MAQHWGMGLIEARGELKLPKLEKALDKAFASLGYQQVYKGKDPPEQEPEENLTGVDLLENGDGVLGVRVGDEQAPVRDLARLLNEEMAVPLRVLLAAVSLYQRRTVRVECRKFGVDAGRLDEQPVMGHHDADIGDLEHNELRQLENAMRSRLNDVVQSFTSAEGTLGFKVKKVCRYKREVKKAKFTNPRMARVMTQLERCESFEVSEAEGGQRIVKLVLAGGATSMSYVKPEDVSELEAALEERPELLRRRKG
jgi:hypothetical protein